MPSGLSLSWVFFFVNIQKYPLASVVLFFFSTDDDNFENLFTEVEILAFWRRSIQFIDAILRYWFFYYIRIKEMPLINIRTTPPPKKTPLHSSKFNMHVSPSALTSDRNIILMSGSRGIRRLPENSNLLIFT